ncbi:MAG TPA: hypothetical protein VGQ45_03930 [Gaiellales bacterium]|jgi:acyl-CoA synthetase (NDP forming)|nr:hypothetical protein [Gaiellales bacterium]
MIGAVNVDQCGNMVAVETLSHGHTTGLSVLVTPEQWLQLVDQAEQLKPIVELRRRRSVEAAREAASHAERGSS